jgi:hypothetical protein
MGEFGVHDVEHIAETTIVSGRCYKGPLSVGDTFLSVISLGPTGDRLDSQPVKLKIQEMIAYGREMDQIDEGLTAKIKLAGESGELVSQQSVLSTSSA